ncbi:hypothetical protein [Pontimicrobium sp. MEBiC06410]
MSNLNENSPFGNVNFPDGISNAANAFAANAPVSSSIFQTCTTDNFLNYFFQGVECVEVKNKSGKYGGTIIEETYTGGGINKVYRTNRVTKIDGKRKKIGTVVLIIGTDGAEILKTHNGLVPKKGEQIILLEKNDKDFSKAIMRFKQDESIDFSESSKSLTAFINKRYEITSDQLTSIVNRVDDTSALQSALITIIEKARKVAGPAATVGLVLAEKMIDSAIKGFDEFVEGSLKIDPSFWNPDHKDFKPAVNITKEQIKTLTSSLDVIGSKIDELSFKNMVAAGGLATIVSGPFAFVLAPGAAAFYLYSEEIERVFNSMKTQIKGALGKLKEFLNNTLEKLIKGVNTAINVVLAFISGLWSGLVDFVADVIRLFLFIIKLAIAGVSKIGEAIGTKVEQTKSFIRNFGLYYNLTLENIDNTLQSFGAIDWLDFFKQSFLKFELFRLRLLASIFNKAGKTLEGLNYAEWAYYIAYAILLIVDIILSFFFPGLLATKIAKLGKAGKVLAKIIIAVQNAMALVFKVAFKTVAFSIKSIMSMWSTIVGIIRKGKNKLLEFLDIVLANVGKVLDEAVRGVAKALDDVFNTFFKSTKSRNYFKNRGYKPTKYDEVTGLLTLCPIGK